MPVPSTINDLSTTAGANYPAGTESPSTIDDYLRAHASFLAGLRDGKVGDTGDETIAGVKTFSSTIVGSVSGSAATLSTPRTISSTGDATWSVSFNGSANVSAAMTLANSGVTAGTYKSVTVDAKGRVTGGTNPTTLSGYGITDAQPIDADLTAIAALTGSYGLLKKTGEGAWTIDTSAYALASSLSSYAPLASPAFTGTPTVPTAATGTNTTQAASTAFVKSSLGNMQGAAIYAASQTLTTAQFGSFVQFNGSSVNVVFTLPTPSGNDGGAFAVWNNGTQTLRVSASAGSIYGPMASGASYVDISPGQFYSLVSDGFNYIATLGAGRSDVVPPGAVSAFAQAVPPSGWLECDGSAVSRTTCAALFSAIGTIYGAGNGSTTFNLPNLRGEFIRGLDNGRNVDPGRGIGTFQSDAFQAHQHGYSDWDNAGGGAYVGAGAASTSRSTSSITQASGYSSPRYADETRPRNVAMMYCIKT